VQTVQGHVATPQGRHTSDKPEKVLVANYPKLHDQDTSTMGQIMRQRKGWRMKTTVMN